MIEFNDDGSIKLLPAVEEIKEIETTSVILRRVQVNTNNPAIARLVIEFPVNIENPKEIRSFYHRIIDGKFPSVDHHLTQSDARTFFIEVRRGTKYMYSLLQYLLVHFKKELEKKNSVVVKGEWDKYNTY